MEVGRSLLSPPPPTISRTHLRNSLSSSSVMMLHVHASSVIISTTTTAAQCFPAFLLTQQKHCNFNNSFATQEEKVARAMVDLQSVEDCSLSSEEREKYHFDLYLENMERGLLYHPGLWYSFISMYNLERPCIMRGAQLINEKHAGVNTDLMQIKQNKVSTISPEVVLALAKRALMASQDAALLMEKSRKVHMFVEKNQDPSFDPSGSTCENSIEGKTTLRSIRLPKRQSKKRKVFTKSTNVPSGTSTGMTDKVKRIDKFFDNNNPLRMFLWGPETKQLLTITEERDLFVQIQDLMGLETVKEKLTIQFGREPTLSEWAQATGMSCHELQACISSGIRGRNRVIYANFRLVIHVAKQYEGKGLNIQDLLQEGSIGLMKSLEKFKPKLGCRFSTYAYWWIRQSIMKSIFQHSRTIRLPENVFGELKKIRAAKRVCLHEGRAPTNEELAKQAGMHVGKLENLLRISKNPISIQGHTWIDQDITFQEVTADPRIETPELAVEKQMMRQHVHGLLGALSPRERKLIRLRFGFRHGEPKSLQQIGDLFGISKERVRQLESRALNKMKACCSTLELSSYSQFLL